MAAKIDCGRMSDDLRGEFARIYPMLRGYSILALKRAGLTVTDDNIQECLLAAMRGVQRQPREVKYLQTFCFRSIRWRTTDLVRQRIRERNGPLSCDLSCANDESMLRHMIEPDWSILAAMPSHYRDVLVLAHGIGGDPHSYAKIAKKLNRSILTIERWHGKACTLLLSLLDADARH